MQDTVDPLLRDVHAMFMLPLPDQPGLDAKCNFSAALVLLGLVSGVSAALYDDATVAGVDKREKPGEAFKRLLTHHYPWDLEPPGGIRDQHAAEVLYDAFRNPLTHNLGIADPEDDRKHGTRKVAKGAMSDEKITDIERASERPPAWGPTLRTDSETKADRTKTVLNLKHFYWGVRTMIWRVLEARAGVGAAGVVVEDPIYATAVATDPIIDVASTAPDDFIEGGSPE